MLVMVYTKLYLDFRYKSKDGHGNLLLLVRNGKTSSSIPVDLKLYRQEWDGEKVVNRPDSMQLNAMISKFKSEIDIKIAALSMNKNLTDTCAAEVVKAITSKKPINNIKHILVSQLAYEYMDNDLSNGTKEIYKSVISKVENYGGKDTVITDIDYQWIIGFNKYLSKTQGVNGRAIYLRHLRALCKYAMHLGLINVSPFDDFKIKTEPTKHRVIDIETLRRFYHHQTTKHQERFKDYFFLMFFLIGINAADLFYATHDSVIKGRLDYIRRKTHKKYSIKIQPEAQELLDKYRGRHYLVEAMDHCKDLKNLIHMMNRALGSIGDSVPNDLFANENGIVPVIPGITTYYARHTWATIAHSLGVSIDVISQALGHSFGNRTTLIYVKPDQSQVDSANRLVIDTLLS